MKKFYFCVSLALAGLMTGCVETNEPVDADTKPSWLGSSIYQELKSPDQDKLTGTFSTYLRLVDDLGLGETLNRTGSKTVFPANDEAFQRFFQSNNWGVSSYEQLTEAQKKLLLYNSMLDNALLIDMLSNISGGASSVMKGQAMKHQTNINVIDTVSYMTTAQMPKFNKYWDKYRDNNSPNQPAIHVVSDASRPMMVHFTREHMLTNGITTLGAESDFAVLTGSEYENGAVYIFNVGVQKNEKDPSRYNSNITCQNGYIHQVAEVIVPPGNIAQALKQDSETKYFSRFLDYFSAPFYNPTVTENYNAWAQANNKERIDSIFEVRYFNSKTEHPQRLDPDNNIVNSNVQLNYDPGWNQYSPTASSNGVDYELTDVGAFFVPVDAAVEKFFLQGGDGAYLINLYGKYRNEQNTAEHLAENLDSLHAQKPDILTAFINNLLKSSFVGNAPSKFVSIQNDANENMGMTLDLLQKKADGKYDILFANNGVIYKLNDMIAPDKYQSVMAPSSVYPDMKVMDWAVSEPDNSQLLNIDFHYYLMAMKQNFAFFVPDDAAFDRYYVDPTHLGWAEPRVLRFVWDDTGTLGARATLYCESYQYDPATNTIGENNAGVVPFAQWQSLLIDIMNYHTVVLKEGETIGSNGNHYYKTKHGGEIYVSGDSRIGTQVSSGQQLDNGLTPSTVTEVYNEKNGVTYRIDRVIEPPVNSVYKTIHSESRFTEFCEACDGFYAGSPLLAWVGIKQESEQAGMPSPQDAYIIFTSDYKYANAAGNASSNCLDYNVKMFNTYNYTLYAPNNEAMETAYKAGLPRWTDIQALYEKYAQAAEDDAEANAAKAQAYDMVVALRDFTRYHFQSISVYADNVVESNTYNSLSTDNLGLAIELQVKGGSNQLQVTDAAGVTHTVDANDKTKLSNKMARDYWFNAARTQATSVYTSSFCVVHEIGDPLYVYESKRYDDKWATANARAQGQQRYQQLKKEHKL